MKNKKITFQQEKIKKTRQNSFLKKEFYAVELIPEHSVDSAQSIILAKEIGIILRSGGFVKKLKFSPYPEKKWTATFFKNYVLPIFSGNNNRVFNYALKL